MWPTTKNGLCPLSQELRSWVRTTWTYLTSYSLLYCFLWLCWDPPVPLGLTFYQDSRKCSWHCWPRTWLGRKVWRIRLWAGKSHILSLGTLDDFIKIIRNDSGFEVLDSGSRFYWLECLQLINKNAICVWHSLSLTMQLTRQEGCLLWRSMSTEASKKKKGK